MLIEPDINLCARLMTLKEGYYQSMHMLIGVFLDIGDKTRFRLLQIIRCFKRFHAFRQPRNDVVLESMRHHDIAELDVETSLHRCLTCGLYSIVQKILMGVQIL